MKLSTSEERIVNRLASGKSVSIKMLFRCIRGRWPTQDESHRRQQQYVGSYISTANLKLWKDKKRIIPGEKRGTYRLSDI